MIAETKSFADGLSIQHADWNSTATMFTHRLIRGRMHTAIIQDAEMAEKVFDLMVEHGNDETAKGVAEAKAFLGMNEGG